MFRNSLVSVIQQLDQHNTDASSQFENVLPDIKVILFLFTVCSGLKGLSYIYNWICNRPDTTDTAVENDESDDEQDLSQVGTYTINFQDEAHTVNIINDSQEPIYQSTSAVQPEVEMLSIAANSQSVEANTDIEDVNLPDSHEVNNTHLQNNSRNISRLHLFSNPFIQQESLSEMEINYQGLSC